MRIICNFGDRESIYESDANEILIGRPPRGEKIDLDLTPDSGASRPHAKLTFDGSSYFIEDLNSTNGTFLDGEPIKGKGRVALKNGQIITINHTTLRVDTQSVGGATSKKTADRNDGKIDETDDADVINRDTQPLEGQSAQMAVGETLDAAEPVYSQAAVKDPSLRRWFELLVDLPRQLAEDTDLDSVLEQILTRVVTVIPHAVRGSLLLVDSESGRLRLKASVPPGRPAISQTLVRRAISERRALLWHRGPDTTRSQLEFQMESGMYVPIFWKGDLLGAVCVDNGPKGGHSFDADDLRLLVAVAHHTAMASVQNRMHQEIQRNNATLGRLLANFSPQVRDKLLARARNARLQLGGERSNVAILMSDIRGFTRLTQHIDADDTVDLLNDYYSELVEAVFEQNGTVDKFIGDALLAVFGSPEHDEQMQEHCVKAAYAMQKAMARVSKSRAARGRLVCEIGIGVHYGEVLHGFIGSKDRMEFTIIGDAVNRTARYCSGAGPGEILISPQLYEFVYQMVDAERISIATKHEGDFPALRFHGMRDA